MGFLFYGLGGVGVDKVNAVFFKLLIEVEAKTILQVLYVPLPPCIVSRFSSAFKFLQYACMNRCYRTSPSLFCSVLTSYSAMLQRNLQSYCYHSNLSLAYPADFSHKMLKSSLLNKAEISSCVSKYLDPFLRLKINLC